MTPRHRTRPALLLLTVVLLALLTACGGGGGGGSSSGSSAASLAGGGSAVSSGSSSSDAASALPAVQQRSVVSTGAVRLRSADVGRVRDRVTRLLTTYDGFLADESTTTDTRGRASRTRLVVRVPSRDFATVMSRLAGLGTLVSSRRSAEDVTTRVIDVQARVTAQRTGLRRLRELLGRSSSLSNLLSVEKEVTARQAELDSLVQQQAYLRDQTSLATITLVVARSSHPAAAPARGGFGQGLAHGWAALVVVLAALLRTAGAVLPFALVVGLVGWPAWWVVTRVRRRRTPQAASGPVP